jgi:hypothetical protein
MINEKINALAILVFLTSFTNCKDANLSKPALQNIKLRFKSNPDTLLIREACLCKRKVKINL